MTCGASARGAMSVAVGGRACVGCSVSMLTAARCFLDFFFFCTDAQRVRLRPVFCLLDEDLVERIVGVAGSGEVCESKLKIGSPSSSTMFAVSILQAGYLRAGLTLAAKFASVRRRALSGVARRAWK